MTPFLMRLQRYRWTVRTLLVFAYGVIFIVTLLLYSFLGLALVDSHVSTEKGLFIQRVEATLSSNQNELLDELALPDLEALKSHIEIIRRNLNADFVTIRAPHVALDSMNPEIPKVEPVYMATIGSLFSIQGASYQSNISNEFKSINAKKEVGTETSHPDPCSLSLETVLLVPAVESALSEKRMEYKAFEKVQIECKDYHTLYGVFVQADPVEFGNVLSNLINNSLYYLGQQGAVQVILSGDEKNVKINIHDNGSGIPPEILPILNTNPTTFNKPNGMGFGLRHAKEHVEKWNGSFEITSQFGNWTNVCLTLPRAIPPAWYISEINLTGIKRIVVLDDDPSVHDVWDTRFTPILSLNSSIVLKHAYCEDDLTTTIGENASQIGTLYLIDYELNSSHFTGIDLIEKYHIEESSLLVTSRWKEKIVRTKSEQLRLRIIPKEMATRIPINAPSQWTVPSCILIDDDTTVGDWWNVLGEPQGKSVDAFKSAQDFIEG
jgi:signal transduction histidine kinase